MPNSVEVGPPGYILLVKYSFSYIENSFSNKHLLVPPSLFPELFSMEGEPQERVQEKENSQVNSI